MIDYALMAFGVAIGIVLREICDACFRIYKKIKLRKMKVEWDSIHDEN